MPLIYKQADVFILSSLWEGSSLSLLEAMASGMPVIASKYSCAPEVVEEGVEGFVIEPRDIESMKSNIKWFISHRDSISEMGMLARKKAEAYSWANYEIKIKKVINEIKQLHKW